MDKPSTTQKLALQTLLSRDEQISQRFDLSNAYDIIEKLTLRQYRYINHLIMDGHRQKLYELFIDLGFKPYV